MLPLSLFFLSRRALELCSQNGCLNRQNLLPSCLRPLSPIDLELKIMNGRTSYVHADLTVPAILLPADWLEERWRLVVPLVGDYAQPHSPDAEWILFLNNSASGWRSNASVDVLYTLTHWHSAWSTRMRKGEGRKYVCNVIIVWIQWGMRWIIYESNACIRTGELCLIQVCALTHALDLQPFAVN